MDIFRLENEIALITGGGTGLGFATAKRMAEAGAQVVICGRRENILQEAVQNIGENASYEIYDVTELDKAKDLVDRVNKRVGAPTILVNNAGINMKKPALETSDEDFEKIVKTHVHGAFTLTKCIAPDMLNKKKGSIIFIASMASLIGLSQVIAYSSGKSAILGMVRTLANEWSEFGVRVNGIAPGFIQTPMVQKALGDDEDRRNRVMMRTPMRKLGEPDDIGYAAVYLSSQAAKYITGTILTVDGGTNIGF